MRSYHPAKFAKIWISVIRDFFIQNNPYLLIRDSIRCLLHSHLHNRHHNIRHLLRSHHQGSHLCHPGDQNQVQAGHQLQLFSVFFCHCYCKKKKRKIRKLNSEFVASLKFIYSEKAKNFCEISTVDLSYVVTDKSTVEISQKFVVFSEYMNFTLKFL